MAYEKTLDLSRDLRSVGCGDLDVEGTEYKRLAFEESVSSTFYSLQTPP